MKRVALAMIVAACESGSSPGPEPTSPPRPPAAAADAALSQVVDAELLAPPPRPHRPLEVRVHGTLSQAEAEKALEPQLNGLEACLGGRKARLDLTLEVNADGSVKLARAPIAGDLQEIGDCATHRGRFFRFPASTGPSTIIVLYGP